VGTAIVGTVPTIADEKGWLIKVLTPNYRDDPIQKIKRLFRKIKIGSKI